jgi:hypothetical protein
LAVIVIAVPAKERNIVRIISGRPYANLRYGRLTR